MDFNSIILYPLVNIIVCALGAALVAAIIKLLPEAIAMLKADVGESNFAKLKAVGIAAWNAVEEDSRLGELAGTKISEFEKLLQAKFPGITDDEITFINKAVAGEMNVGKAAVIKAVEPEGILIPAPIATPLVEQPVVIAVPRYFKPDGITELIDPTLPVADLTTVVIPAPTV
jgi:hypothetical protein